MYLFEEDHEPTIEDLENKAKVFFQVVVHYNKDLIKEIIPKHHADKAESLGTFESIAIGTFNEAEEVVSEMTTKIHSKFPDSKIKDIEPEEQEDEYHVWVSNEEGEAIAKLGVVAIDYSEATIH